MVGRDQWFSIHATGPAETALSKTPGTAGAPTGGGFLVDPEAIPAVKAGFETAIQEMLLARREAQRMNDFRGESVNPVVDKFMAALIDRATGSEGSFVVMADSAIAAYQDVIDQLDAVVAGYRGSDDDAESQFPGES
jgi:hypothetical protein